jgi:hypothetical protein
MSLHVWFKRIETKKDVKFSVLLLAVFLIIGMAACSGEKNAEPADGGNTTAEVIVAATTQKTFNVNGSGKVVGVASQHRGNAWNKDPP